MEISGYNEIFSYASRYAVVRMIMFQKLRPGWAGRCEARPGGARRGQAVRCKAKQGEVTSSIQRAYCWMHWRKLQQGVARHGMAWQGAAGLGKDKQGKVDSKHPAISVAG